jgi:hypothetical protein
MKIMTSHLSNLERPPVKTVEVSCEETEVLRLFLNRALGLRRDNNDPLCFEHVRKQSQSTVIH